MEGVSDEGGTPTGEVSSNSFCSEDFGESFHVALVQFRINLTTTFDLPKKKKSISTYKQKEKWGTYQIERSDESMSKTTSNDSTDRASKIIFRGIQLDFTEWT